MYLGVEFKIYEYSKVRYLRVIYNNNKTLSFTFDNEEFITPHLPALWLKALFHIHNGEVLAGFKTIYTKIEANQLHINQKLSRRNKKVYDDWFNNYEAFNVIHNYIIANKP